MKKLLIIAASVATFLTACGGSEDMTSEPATPPATNQPPAAPAPAE